MEKKQMVGLVVLAACALSGVFGADVWRDVTHVWSFDQDLNGDGVLQANEVRDVRYWGSATGGTEGGLAPSDIKKNGDNQLPQWQSGEVFWPARGVTIPNTSWIHLDCVTNYNGEGKRTGYQNGIVFYNSTITGSVSVVTRVRATRFGAHRDSRTSYIVNNGEAWNAWAGANIGFISVESVEFTNAYAYVMLGQKAAQMPSIKLNTNTWYDVGYSIKDRGDGYAEILFMVAGASKNGSQPFSNTLRMSTVTLGPRVFTNETGHATSLYIGGETLGQAHENGLKCFMGDVHRVAMWSRALSADELAEALGSPATYFRAGYENGANGEFGKTDEVDWDASPAPDTEPWRKLPRALSAAHPTLKMSYTPRTAESRGLGALFRVVATPGSEATTFLTLTIGGKSQGTKILRAGQEASWFVKGGTLVAGANAITLTRTSGSGSECALDVLEMTGSWMLGIENGNNAEFTVENEVANMTYLMNWDTHAWTRGVVGDNGDETSTPNGNLYLRFYVPGTLAERYDARFTGRAASQGAGTGGYLKLTNTVENGGMGWKLNQWPFGVDLNGVERYATNGIPGNTYYSFDIPRGTLSNGWNVIRTHLNENSPNAGHWFCFDFHKLEFLPNPTGAVLILR